MNQQFLTFDARFLTRHAGAIISDPVVAIVELVANAWDAYATRVEIEWPDRSAGKSFRITDNGKGMTEEQFRARWGTIDYNRLEAQGPVSLPPSDLGDRPPRPAYGRNGRGRHAAFCFAEAYELCTWRDGTRLTLRVSFGKTHPVEFEVLQREPGVGGHGTRITALESDGVSITSDKVREVLGTRFLVDPSFQVFVDGVEVTFDDVPAAFLRDSTVDVPGWGEARILMIDARKADRTTRHHGIAWRVLNRLVGTPGWQGSDYERVLDGRTSEAKRFTFIVSADFLADAVEPDWSGFQVRHPAWEATRPLVQDTIRSLIGSLTLEAREETKAEVRARHDAVVATLSPISRDRWSTFVDQVVDVCPAITPDEISQVAGILANLEQATSRYGLLAKLHEMGPGDLDQLHELLGAWTVRTAKMALDEIQTRLTLIAELDVKLRDERSDEVKDLQPLFERGLWIFGPQFESIEFTSNRGMTEVISKLFGISQKGSLNRPDFAVVPDGSVGFYALDTHGKDFEVTGVGQLVIVEIKRPGITIGTEQKNQAWKYVKELMDRGLVTRATEVHCFVLGSQVDPSETQERLEGNVTIQPMAYDVFVRRAERRLLNLRAKLHDAPFLASHSALPGRPTQQQLTGVA